MRSQNRKVNNTRPSSGFTRNAVGKASCLGLLALMLALVNPVSSSVFAEEASEDAGDQPGPVELSGDAEGGAGDGSDGSANYDNQVSAQASTLTDSTITISFDPSNASGSVTPVDTSTGDAAKVDVQATVRVQNSGGYSVYVGSTSSQLKNGNNVIDSVTSATTYANMPVNRWGYSFRKATSATDKTVTDSYSAMPATVRSTALDSNTATSIKDETRYYMLSFAARIGSDKPSGTYTNSVTLSVVSSPLETTVNGLTTITNMQDITSAICSASTTGDAKQLKDTRDGKFYWVGKLADGKCWMTQNLDLDLSTSTKLTSDTSDVPVAGWTPGYTTATTASTSTISSSTTSQYSWSLGNYRITNPTTSSDCGTKKASAASCTSQFTAYTTPTAANSDTNAHYILGNHYAWNAATAGTGGSITSGTATNSICPKGWRLPTGGNSGELQALVAASSISTDVAKLTGAPYYFVRGGSVYQNTSYLFAYSGAEGIYWSSTPGTSNSATYSLLFNATDNINLAYFSNRSAGLSVRCVAR